MKFSGEIAASPPDKGTSFLLGVARFAGLAGTLLFLWPAAASMRPAADAHSPLVVNLSTIVPGDRHYDLSGRLREGHDATGNLPIPEYVFLNKPGLAVG